MPTDRRGVRDLQVGPGVIVRPLLSESEDEKASMCGQGLGRRAALTRSVVMHC